MFQVLKRLFSCAFSVFNELGLEQISGLQGLSKKVFSLCEARKHPFLAVAAFWGVAERRQTEGSQSAQNRVDRLLKGCIASGVCNRMRLDAQETTP